VFFADNIVSSVFQPDSRQAYIENTTTLFTDGLGDDAM
jgi:hypothetical protein